MNTPLSQLLRNPSEAIDANGRRTILHACSAGQLLSVADANGLVRRQELVFEREIIVWQHGTRIRTGLVPKGASDSTAATFDAHPNNERLTRARQALGRYRGPDKYLHHLDRVLSLSAGLALVDTDVVTRTAQDFEKEGLRPPRRSRSKRYLMALLLIVISVAAFTLVFWLVSRP